MIDIGSIYAFGAALLKRTSLTVLELIRTLPAFIIEWVVKFSLALLALLVVRAEIASTDQLTAILTDVVWTNAVTRLAGLAVSGGVASKTVGDNAAA